MSGAVCRSARENARRTVACSRHCLSACNHAPRPCADVDSSTTTLPSTTTNLTSDDRSSVERHPMHVLTDVILPPWEHRVGRVGSGLAYAAYDSITESGWMSILAPVSLAANRAFWPSLPIASES